jgi:hypothetical protein
MWKNFDALQKAGDARAPIVQKCALPPPAAF